MGYAFSDGGYVWYKKEHRLAQYGLSLGLGAGILTQEGQIRVEVAIPFSDFYTKDNWFNSPRYALRVNQSFWQVKMVFSIHIKLKQKISNEAISFEFWD